MKLPMKRNRILIMLIFLCTFCLSTSVLADDNSNINVLNNKTISDIHKVWTIAFNEAIDVNSFANIIQIKDLTSGAIQQVIPVPGDTEDSIKINPPDQGYTVGHMYQLVITNIRTQTCENLDKTIFMNFNVISANSPTSNDSNDVINADNNTTSINSVNSGNSTSSNSNNNVTSGNSTTSSSSNNGVTSDNSATSNSSSNGVTSDNSATSNSSNNSVTSDNSTINNNSNNSATSDNSTTSNSSNNGITSDNSAASNSSNNGITSDNSTNSNSSNNGATSGNYVASAKIVVSPILPILKQITLNSVNFPGVTQARVDGCNTNFNVGQMTAFATNGNSATIYFYGADGVTVIAKGTLDLSQSTDNETINLVSSN